MNKSIIILFVLTTLILSSCISNNSTQQDRMPIKVANVIASCDDSNPCTEDVFNS